MSHEEIGEWVIRNGTTRAIGPYTAGRCGDLIFLRVRHAAGAASSRRTDGLFCKARKS
jgi:hypothetical protein